VSRQQKSTPAPPTDAPRAAMAGDIVGRFTGPAAVLGFIGAAPRSNLRTSPSFLREPDGSLWVVTSGDPDVAIDLIRTSGGAPFRATADAFLPVPSRPGGEIRRQRLASWADVGPVELVLAAPLIPTEPAALAEARVFTGGGLVRWILRRCLDAGLDVTLTEVRPSPLTTSRSGATPNWPVASLLTLRAPGGVVPAALVTALGMLPGTIVCRAAGTRPLVLVDVRYRSTLGDQRLAEILASAHLGAGGAANRRVDADSPVVLGGPDVGSWELTLCGEAIPAGDLVRVDLPVAAPAGLTVADLPAPRGLPSVRLVPTSTAPARIDGVLVSDDQLAALRAFLTGRPATEDGFLVLGAGRHLLTEPAGLVNAVPFGTPVRRAEPGLYLEAGCELRPRPPAGALAQVYGLDASSFVVLTRLGAYQFATDKLVPAWSLWLGKPPTVATELSAPARQLLSGLVALGTTPGAQTLPSDPRPAGPRVDRQALLEEAQRLALGGRLIDAAERLERAGDYEGAARLLEQAAEMAGS
jgi:hypothetical protein